jgi:2-dehydro-3-deoxyphosphogluconate aldolase/(4S)-4-hydroxy-2-oxoglutarate aldolase
MSDVLDAIATQLVLPLVSLDDADAAVAAAAALAAGGLGACEVTLRTPRSVDVLAAVAADRSRLVGAGTVLEPAQVDLAVDLGASFVVSPGLDERVLVRATERGIVAIPGVATATEIQAARRLGVPAVKFFPARQLGGAAGVAAVAAAFPDMRFLPTGGIRAGDLQDYLRLPCVLAVGGSWLIDPDIVARQDWDAITEAAAAAIRTACAARPT